MKKRAILLIILIIYGVLQLLTLHPQKQIAKKFKAKGFPLIIAHGGAKLLYPENTVYAFDQSVALGVDALEMDLRLTKDNVLVTHHNETIEETSDAKGKVRDYTYEEIKQFNFGATFKDINGNTPFLKKQADLIPAKLEDLFARYGKKVLFILEIKDEGKLGEQAAQEIARLVKKYDIAEDVNVASFIQANNAYYRTVRDEKTSTSAGEELAKTMVYSMYGGWDFALDYAAEGVQFPVFEKLPLDTSYLIGKLHKHNLFVHFWTINDEKTMHQLIDKRVDGIITDRPDLLKKIKDELKNND